MSWREAATEELRQLRLARASRVEEFHWTQGLSLEDRRMLEAKGATEWPSAQWEEIIEKSKTGVKPTLPSADETARAIDAAVARTVAQVREAKKSRAVEPAPKKAKVERGLSQAAREAFDAVWAMEFGDERTNPFRIRLTEQNCIALGLPDYYQKVPEPCDLILVKERMQASQYVDDAALRRDIKRIVDNTRLYHPQGSPYITAADQLLRAFDSRLGVGRRLS